MPGPGASALIPGVLFIKVNAEPPVAESNRPAKSFPPLVGFAGNTDMGLPGWAMAFSIESANTRFPNPGNFR